MRCWFAPGMPHLAKKRACFGLYAATSMSQSKLLLSCRGPVSVSRRRGAPRHRNRHGKVFCSMFADSSPPTPLLGLRRVQTWTRIALGRLNQILGERHKSIPPSSATAVLTAASLLSSTESVGMSANLPLPRCFAPVSDQWPRSVARLVGKSSQGRVWERRRSTSCLRRHLSSADLGHRRRLLGHSSTICSVHKLGPQLSLAGTGHLCSGPDGARYPEQPTLTPRSPAAPAKLPPRSFFQEPRTGAGRLRRPP
ncbi:hypothetical protein DFJ74DRAFT_144616 [Hyaloraphidium curvatum]|nr:hypothetical protein DFJ74DRAFT_144616 [Hyaloraphidium curvatum]